MAKKPYILVIFQESGPAVSTPLDLQMFFLSHQGFLFYIFLLGACIFLIKASIRNNNLFFFSVKFKYAFNSVTCGMQMEIV